jgi:PKD repeat protein
MCPVARRLLAFALSVALASCVEEESLPPNVAPQVSVVTDASGAPLVVFDARATRDEDGSVVRWFFEYGDGSADEVSASPFARHTYAAPGTYLVTVSAVDDRGDKGSLSLNLVVPTWPGAPDPVVPGADVGVDGDAGASDAGASDSGSSSDSSSFDTGPLDDGFVDSGPIDAGPAPDLIDPTDAIEPPPIDGGTVDAETDADAIITIDAGASPDG